LTPHPADVDRPGCHCHDHASLPHNRLSQPISLADQHLLSLIRQGDQDGWAQFLQRYQGRMIAFAKSQTNQRSDAEDLVQDTFIGFIRSLDNFRQESDLESWLFRILRRRIIDYYRSRGANKEVTACCVGDAGDGNLARDPIATATDPHSSPGAKVQREEQQQGDNLALSTALHSIIDRLKNDSNLRDLMIMEGLFYAGLKNRALSRLIALDEGRIAVIRHRMLKRLKSSVEQQDSQQSESSLPSVDLLTRIWERDRPSCPKRTTLGKSLIGILDEPWQQYVTFHVDTIGCRYCQANREDLAADDRGEAHSQRIFQSTIGFVSRR
jgi:RNA polymerase sigma factor (sigma-70 family)